MSIDADGEREPPDEDKGTQDGILGEGLEARDLNVDTATEDEKGAGKALQDQEILAVQQQQSQGTTVCWERFLHVRSIRVLLVENDDSTRHVVTALLRNCNYEVMDAANGLEAWKILEDLTNHIDIVLTEVVLPFLSGISLLCKIMNHKTRKNVPVIMMSSHDAVGLVFQCLSRGALDFLVKPIRKNELKTLWQHVWRRCHSSSGSGSESGTQTQKYVKSKSSEKADNSGSDDGGINGSNGLNIGDGSDDGSGAQSSWTKQAVEVDSSQAMSPIDRVAECADSTCAQVIRPNAENFRSRRVDNSVSRDGHEQNEPDTVAKGKDLETIIPRNVESKSEKPMEVPITYMAKLKSLSESDIRESGYTKEVTSILNINKDSTNDSKESDFKHSLKRLQGFQDIGRSIQDDRCVIRRSEQSAFSRYNTSSNAFKAHNGITGSSSIIDNSVEVAKRDSVGAVRAHSMEQLIYQSSNGVSNNIDMGSTTNKLSKQPSACKPAKNDVRYTRSHVSLLHNSEKQPSYNLEQLSPVDAPHCGSTNVTSGPIDGDLMKYSFNRSASGSNHGSNGQNGSSAPVNAVGTNVECDFDQGGKSGSGDASGSSSGTRVSENKLAIREAALKKFRQKKKERCFKRKVRYQNRKKLAEQRPRVRGQFVKQTGTESSG
ncbi:hypothetical protein BUALT_Bualt11G0114400 [Buddleja alternifolia]|uniref:Pseudo-response regulator 7 n=1 Tax=Buddleja alternifolia TaxID=168488 RepID=A0AAV6X549_9LAMI|nr:hypothetical protein BUALT_Bualt11G0114400 [Buddleja alternifolia]